MARAILLLSLIGLLLTINENQMVSQPKTGKERFVSSSLGRRTALAKTKSKYRSIIIIRATNKTEAENLLKDLVRNTGEWTRAYGMWDLVEPGAAEQILKKNYAWYTTK
jgi:chemotaxis methyl-accepting protein methylase